MSNQRGTFAKRQREGELKDRARAKQARRAAKRAEVRTTKGPQIAWDEAVYPVTSDEASPGLDPVTATDDDAPGSDPGDDAPPRGA
jgi:hypothetical protein